MLPGNQKNKFSALINGCAIRFELFQFCGRLKVFVICIPLQNEGWFCRIFQNIREMVIAFARMLNFDRYNEVFLLVLFLSLQSVSFSQDSEVAVEEASVTGYRGTLKYEYYLSGSDTIFDGEFYFTSNIENKELNNSRSLDVEGRFSKNLPTGSWEFKIGNFTQTDKKNLVDYQYVIQATGVEKVVLFEVQGGEPSGDWLFRMDTVVDSEVVKSIFKSEFSYVGGVPQKSFRIESDTEFMIGGLLRNAVAHDVWSLFTEEGINEVENWKFDQGRLESILVSREDSTLQLEIGFGNHEKIEVVSLDQHYLDIIELRIQLQFPDFYFDGGMSKLLEVDSDNYEEILDFFEDLNRPLKVQGFKVDVPVYPISKKERDDYEQIFSNTSLAGKLIDSLLGDAQLNLLRLSDSEFADYFSISNLVNDKFLVKLIGLQKLDREDLLKHLSREETTELLWPNGIPYEVRQFQNTVPSDVTLLSSSASYDFKEKNLQSLVDLSRYVLGISGRLDSIVNQKLSNNKREQAFLNQEKLLIDEAERKKNYVDSLSDRTANDVAKVFRSLNVFIEAGLEKYAKMSENSDKLAYSQELINCFDDIRKLADAIYLIPKQREEVNGLYQDQVWNPFTATVMDEAIKKRITKAYNSRLLPYFFNQVETNLTCSEIQEWTEFLTKLHDRMIALRNEDTKRLERKLKRTRDPEDILSLFDLDEKDE